MAIAPSKLGRLVRPMLHDDAVLLRLLRANDLVMADVPDEVLIKEMLTSELIE